MAPVARSTRRPDTGLRDRLLAVGANPHPVRISEARLMHATAGPLPLGPGWLYELKADGYRVLAGRQRGRPHVRYRRGSEGTASWPELAAALAGLPFEDLVLDAELVVAEAGRPAFALVQQRFGLTRKREVEHAAARHPAQLLAFDLLALDGLDLRSLPLETRKAALGELLAGQPPTLQCVYHVGLTQAQELYERARELGGEGVVAKRLRSLYQPGESKDWIKVRQAATLDAAVVGYSLGGGRVPALHLAGLHASEGLTYVGSVKTGFPRGFLSGAGELLPTIRRPDPPCRGVAADVAQAWVEPRIVVEVGYVEATPTGVLRHATFIRLRPDKPPEECVLPEGFGAGIEGRPLHHRRSRW